MRVLLLDNADSFTWNLVHGLELAGGRCTVVRADAVSLAEIETFRPDRLVLSPGPWGPDRAGICPQALAAWRGRVPILGVCLGMQVIAVSAGAAVVPSGRPRHGVATPVWHDGAGVLAGLPNPFEAARYHSLIVAPASVPPALTVTARDAEGTILGCRAADGVEGVLFHPESFLTPDGGHLFANFLES